MSEKQNIDAVKSQAEEGWKKEFAESKDLQSEFRDEKTYVAYKRAQDSKQTK